MLRIAQTIIAVQSPTKQMNKIALFRYVVFKKMFNHAKQDLAFKKI